MADKKVKMGILRDFWDADGKRHRKGAIIELPASEALKMAESGMAASVKEDAE